MRRCAPSRYQVGRGPFSKSVLPLKPAARNAPRPRKLSGRPQALGVRVVPHAQHDVITGMVNEPVCWLKGCKSGQPSALIALHQSSADVTLAAVSWNMTHSSFGMPRGARYREPGPTLNHELGRDREWLPVTHTHTQQDAWQVGLWLHYMRGCSDFVWNVGRTMLARNKCEASGLLEQRAAVGLSWPAAIDRVAHKFVAALHHNQLLHATRLTTRAQLVYTHGAAQVADALGSCAAGHGLQSVDPALAEAILSNALDYIMAATMRLQLVGTPAELDTLQFYNLCEAPLSTATPGCDGNAEVWDVRFLQQRATVPPTGVPGIMRPVWEAGIGGSASDIFGRLPLGTGLARPQPCNLSTSWHYCLACEASASERSCCYTCSARTAPNRTCGKYGPNMESHLLRRLDRRNPLTLETLWSVGVGWWWLELGRGRDRHTRGQAIGDH